MINVGKYACRLHSLPEGSLLKVACETSVKLDSEAVKTWYSGMRHMLQKSRAYCLFFRFCGKYE